MNHPTIFLFLLQLSALVELTTSTSFRSPPFLTLRGGSTTTATPPTTATTTSATTTKTKKQEAVEAIQNYKFQQQHLLQLRSTFLSEALSMRGIKVGPTMMDVSTPEGSKPPQRVDWACCLSTEDDPKTCLYSFDAEPNTKVVCPIGTTQYISLGALNRLRRTDPSKVGPMWHSQYAILESWFSDESEYSLLQYVGLKGFIISTLLLDLGKGKALKGLLAFSILSICIIFMPVIEVIVSRILTSSTLWMKWQSWGKFAHAALPLKILIGQMVWKSLAGSFQTLEGFVREQIVDLECAILEESIPVTVGSAVEGMDADSLRVSADEDSDSDDNYGDDSVYDFDDEE